MPNVKVWSVPQVFVGDRFIGQVGEVRRLALTGKLQAIVDGPSDTPPNA